LEELEGKVDNPEKRPARLEDACKAGQE